MSIPFKSNNHGLDTIIVYAFLLSWTICFENTNTKSIWCRESVHFFVVKYPKMMKQNRVTDCCNWDGVTCNKFIEVAIGLDLSCGTLNL